jgi:PAS domain S-box-containing protein
VFSDDRSALFELWNAALATGTPGQVEARLRRFDGQYRWFSIRVFPRLDDAMAVVGAIGHAIDIEDRKRPEPLLAAGGDAAVVDALRRSEERYARAMEAAQDGHWEWNIATGEMFVSTHMKEMLGFAADAHFANGADFFARRPVHPDDRAYVTAVWDRALAGSTPQYEMEYRVLPRPGDMRWMRSRAKVFRDNDGNPWCITGSLSDITEAKLASEALRTSAQRYALAMEAAGEAFWDWDVVTDEYYVSPRMMDVLGMPPGIVFRNRSEFISRIPFHPEDLPRWQQGIDAHFAGATPRFDVEIRVLSGGRTRWIHLRGLLSRDASGKPLRWTGAVANITERRAAQEALRASEQRYALAMEAAAEGHIEWIAATDELYTSPRVLEMCGLPADTRFAGRADFLARFPFHPEDRDGIVSQINAHFAGRASRLEIETRILRRGETRWMHITILCLRNASGALQRACMVYTDVTESICAQAALRESEERFALAVAGANEGIFDWDLPTDRLFMSPRAQQLFAMESSEPVRARREWLAMMRYHPDDVDRVRDAIRAHIFGRTRAFEIEFRVLIPNQGYRWYRQRGAALRDGAGKAYRMAGSIEDVTDRKEAESELRLRKEELQRVMDSISDCLWSAEVKVDGSVSYRYYSPVVERITGRPPAYFVDRPERWFESIHPLDRPRVAEAFRRIASGATDREEEEYRILRSDGTVRWVRDSVRATRVDDGRVLLDGIASDVTERTLAAEALREGEARFRSLTELLSDWYWRQDENLRFTYLSSQARDLTGYTGESSYGKTRWELSNHRPLSGSWDEHKAVLAARQPFRDLETCRISTDGTPHYLSMSGAPIFDEDGRFKGYHGIGRNITERKRIEEELRARQDMLNLAQKAARAAAFEWHLGTAKEATRWSPDLESMLGLAPGSYDGSFEAWKKLVHPQDWPAVSAAIERARESGDISAEYRILHPDGTVHWLQTKGRVFLDAEGKPARLVGFMLDVTERHVAEEELQRMERALRQAQRLEAMGSLAGGIAHDFNNLLGAILGYGEMALRDAPAGSRLRRDVESIMIAGERGRALVDRVLAFSRSGIGEHVAVPVQKVIRETLGMFAAKAPDNVVVEQRLRAGRAAVKGDATQIHQVLMNLATNAAHAMPSGGTLRVSLECTLGVARSATIGALAAKEYVVLRVADTGSGIPPEVIERIFDPFFTTKEVGVGSGLGLSLVHGIVTGLGGAIDVETTVGTGTTFTVYLPWSGELVSDATERRRAQPRVSQGRHERILVVDDEEALVRLIVEQLGDLGYVATGFTSGAAALEAFRADPRRFDAIVTDQSMPGMTGAELMREIRAQRPSIPILLVSGYVTADVARRLRAAGADDVMKKPLAARELGTCLARLLRGTKVSSQPPSESGSRPARARTRLAQRAASPRARGARR